jgi:hypothetical protein
MQDEDTMDLLEALRYLDYLLLEGKAFPAPLPLSNLRALGQFWQGLLGMQRMLFGLIEIGTFLVEVEVGACGIVMKLALVS